MLQPVNGQKVTATSMKYCGTQENWRPLHSELRSVEQKTQNDGNQIINYMRGLGLTVRWSHLKKLNWQHVSGTKAKLGGYGIAKILKRYGRIKYLSKLYVLFVIKHIARFSPLVRSSATKIVKLQHYAVEEQPIYNITVDHHHCYLANGLMVSNSNGADFLRYACINAPQMTNDSIDDYWHDNQSHHRYDSGSVNQATGY
jgi:hypothetical protein